MPLFTAQEQLNYLASGQLPSEQLPTMPLRELPTGEFRFTVYYVQVSC